MTTESKQILEELKSIKSDLEYLKEHFVDSDSVMTEEDYESLLEYRKEKKSNKLISHESLKKELGL